MSKPNIVVGDTDYVRLTDLANAAFERMPAVAETLLAELGRANVRADRLLSDDIVRMGSAVEFETSDGARRRVTLVYPADADIAENKVSILTPVGTALLGLTTGQSIDWIANDGRLLRLRIVAVGE